MNWTLGIILTLAVAARAVEWNNVGIYIEKNFNWGSFDQDIKTALDLGYNRIYLGFYMKEYGCQGSCSAFVSLTPQARSNILSTIHAYGAEIYLSAGGPGEYIESIIQHGGAADFGNEASQFASQYGFDGIDLSVHLAGEYSIPSIYANNGSFIEYCQDFLTSASNNGWTRDSLMISGQAPYFAPAFVGGNGAFALSYLALDVNVGKPWSVSQIMLNMFNEDQNYMSYQDMFVANQYYDPYYGMYASGSAIKEQQNLGNSGVITILKPMNNVESSVHAGYIDPNTLGQWGCQALHDSSIKWTGGFTAWTWNKDDESTMGSFVSAIQGQC